MLGFEEKLLCVVVIVFVVKGSGEYCFLFVVGYVDNGGFFVYCCGWFLVYYIQCSGVRLGIVIKIDGRVLNCVGIYWYKIMWLYVYSIEGGIDKEGSIRVVVIYYCRWWEGNCSLVSVCICGYGDGLGIGNVWCYGIYYCYQLQIGGYSV